MVGKIEIYVCLSTYIRAFPQLSREGKILLENITGLPPNLGKLQLQFVPAQTTIKEIQFDILKTHYTYMLGLFQSPKL